MYHHFPGNYVLSLTTSVSYVYVVTLFSFMNIV